MSSKDSHDSKKHSEKKSHFELEDFVDKNVEIKTDFTEGKKVSAQARLIDFANIKLEAVDPRIKKEVTEKISLIRKKLQRLKRI